MKRLFPIIVCAFLSLSIRAQSSTFTMHPESPSVIGRISLISPKLIAEFAPADFFTQLHCRTQVLF